MGIGIPELIIVALVVILLFGGAQLPKLARSLGSFISEFNAAKEEAPKSKKAATTAKKKKTSKAKKA